MPNRPAIYWDSCVFIDRIQRRADRIGVLEAITDGAAAGDFLIVTSAVAIAEVIKLPEVGGSSEEQVRTIAEFFDNGWISIRPVDQVIGEMAAQIRREHGIKTCDAIHIATALRFEVPVFHTYDGSSKERRGLLDLNGTWGPKLQIIQPTDPRQQNPTEATEPS